MSCMYIYKHVQSIWQPYLKILRIQCFLIIWSFSVTKVEYRSALKFRVNFSEQIEGDWVLACYMIVKEITKFWFVLMLLYDIRKGTPNKHSQYNTIYTYIYKRQLLQILLNYKHDNLRFSLLHIINVHVLLQTNNYTIIIYLTVN